MKNNKFADSLANYDSSIISAARGEIAIPEALKQLEEKGIVVYTGRAAKAEGLNYGGWNPHTYHEVYTERDEEFDKYPVHAGSSPEGDYWREYLYKGELSYECHNDGDFISDWYNKYGYIEEEITKLKNKLSSAN